MDNRRIIILLIVFFIFIFSSYIIYYDKMQKDILEERLSGIEGIKQKNIELDKTFLEHESIVRRKLADMQEKNPEKDKDDDGLTLAEEEMLGTSDYSKDSDGDMIPDAKDAHPNGGDRNIVRTVNWVHDGKNYYTQFGIKEDAYLNYKNYSLRGYCCLGWDKFVTPDDITIKTIAKDIVDTSIVTGETDLFSLAVDFVQSMVYQYDIDYGGKDEYPKFPIETIVDEKGDCEDTSFLMASILKNIGYDVVLLKLPGHMAVGVKCDDCKGTYVSHAGKTYYYLETTGNAGSWRLGVVPDQFEDLEIRVIKV